MKIKVFQMGGPMGPEGAPEEAPMGGAPAPEAGGAPAEAGAPAGGEDPIMQIAQVAMQALQAQDCEAAMAVCEAYLQLIQQSQGGAPEEAAPEGEPVYRNGGVLSRRIY